MRANPVAHASSEGNVGQRLDRLEAKVDDGFHRVYEGMALGFAGHRGWVLGRFDEVDRRFEQVDRRFEQIDRRFEQIDQRFEKLERRMDSFDNRLQSHALETIARFDRLEGKLDGFIDAQSAVNRKVLEKLDALTALVTAPPFPPPRSPP
jgi:tetrahydromethanopterin S-methyltransferase subunit G